MNFITRLPPSATETTSALSSPPPKLRRVPGLVLRPGRVRHSHSPPPRSRSSSTSTAPPVSLVPRRRAGRTRESFMTRQSPGRSSSARSEKTRWLTSPVSRSMHMSREESRFSSGVWAMSSGGSSK